MYKKNKKQNYASFTLIEMMIVMAVALIIFLATSSILTSMMKASNTVTSRIVVREEGEYLSEIIRKHVRNASYDVIRVYNRPYNPNNPANLINFHSEDNVINYSRVTDLGGNAGIVPPSTGGPGNEIHFRPSDNPREMVCIGFFVDQQTGRGYIVRSKVDLPGDFTLATYHPNQCFPPNNPSINSQVFRNNFMVLNSDLVNIENFRISLAPGGLNNYYTFEVTIQPHLGLGGFSRYNESSQPDYVKTFVVQTRAYRSW